MKRPAVSLAVVCLVAAFLAADFWSTSAITTATGKEAGAPFGSETDRAFAGKLWQALEEQRLVGAKTIRATPYMGREPHGAVLVTLEATVEVSGRQGVALVKKNYEGSEITKTMVADDPDEWLASITVMYQREDGYDADHKNWFWAKYGPDGKLLSNPDGTKLAGRVAKGSAQGCIACHQAAPGGDYVFGHDRLKQD